MYQNNRDRERDRQFTFNNKSSLPREDSEMLNEGPSAQFQNQANSQMMAANVGGPDGDSMTAGNMSSIQTQPHTLAEYQQYYGGASSA